MLLLPGKRPRDTVFSIYNKAISACSTSSVFFPHDQAMEGVVWGLAFDGEGAVAKAVTDPLQKTPRPAVATYHYQEKTFPSPETTEATERTEKQGPALRLPSTHVPTLPFPPPSFSSPV